MCGSDGDGEIRIDGIVLYVNHDYGGGAETLCPTTTETSFSPPLCPVPSGIVFEQR